MHRDGRYGPCRSLSPPIVKQVDYRGWEERCQVWVSGSDYHLAHKTVEVEKDGVIIQNSTSHRRVVNY